jgi:hypothetical protein
MTLRPYADTPVRLTLQLCADALVLLWVVLWVLVGRFVHATVTGLAKAGFLLRDGADGVASNLLSAGSGVHRVPLVGDALASSLSSAGGAAGGVAGAGQQLGDRITGLALPLSLIVALAPILSVGLVWGMLRLRFARRAGMAAELAQAPGGNRLLALRALATRPLHELAAVSEDPLEAFLNHDEAVMTRLADLELAGCGVRRQAALRPAA